MFPAFLGELREFFPEFLRYHPYSQPTKGTFVTPAEFGFHYSDSWPPGSNTYLIILNSL